MHLMKCGRKIKYSSGNSFPRKSIMMEILGFHGFGSTKGKAVVTNQFGPAKAAELKLNQKDSTGNIRIGKGHSYCPEASITSKSTETSKILLCTS